MDDNQTERAAFCALNRIFGFEPGLAHSLVSKLGSATAVFTMSDKGRREALGYGSKYFPLISKDELEKSRIELETLEREGSIFIPVSDKDFPRLLKECPDPPLGLYFKSRFPPGEVFARPKSIAVVGTRDISPYGRDVCASIVSSMSRSVEKPLIVSGFAMGTDITAHKTALDCSLPTVAVLPTGIETIYPQKHWRWAESMVSTPGCALVTDYPPGTYAAPINFLRRNRIIAGLSEVTVLIESKAKGGGLITCDFAFNYNRDVYAVPGRIEDPRSEGCNNLIKKHVAEAVVSVESLMEDLGLGGGRIRKFRDLAGRIRACFIPILGPDESERLVRIASCISGNRGITPEELAIRLEMDYPDVAAAIGMLQSEGFVETDLLQGCSIKTKIP